MLNEYLERIEVQFSKYSTQDNLFCDGAVFYLNEPENTKEIWNRKHRLCEFMNFYQSTSGYISCIVLATGFAEFSRFTDDINSEPQYLALVKIFSEEEVEQLANFFITYADEANNVDESLELFKQI